MLKSGQVGWNNVDQGFCLIDTKDDISICPCGYNADRRENRNLVGLGLYSGYLTPTFTLRDHQANNGGDKTFAPTRVCAKGGARLPGDENFRDTARDELGAYSGQLVKGKRRAQAH